VGNSWREGGDTTQLKETILKTNENITEKLKLQALQISVSSWKLYVPKNFLPLFGEKY
jgi:hypothetical protein